MIINSSPEHEVTMSSDITQTSEFKIKASAKSFMILSSGLYANKIRAIIRELSTNAIDSHVMAMKPDMPFDVHLPNVMEPYFSVRDYGIGLSAEDVQSVYTTYFESTKTNSNDAIGCLGLGSKSPFSYTDNFTVTAIRDGVKNVFSAYINDHGVPSVALLSTSETDDPTGVEIQFAVTDASDFGKFAHEAREVYAWFTHMPIVSGVNNFAPKNIEFSQKNIIDGVHSLAYSSRSFAVMGNICYPIDMPNPQENLGNLASLLNCGLVLDFNIGELEFQPSREGLSYIPLTINSIKQKLQDLTDNMADVLKQEFDKYTNIWDLTIAISKKGREKLWQPATEEYIKKYYKGIYATDGYWRPSVDIMEYDIKRDFNIKIMSFSKMYPNMPQLSTNKVHNEWNHTTRHYDPAWQFCPTMWENTIFVRNDTNIGVGERAKYHFRKADWKGLVFVLDAADPSQPAKYDEFLEFLGSPPSMLASTLEVKPKKGSVVSYVTGAIYELTDTYSSDGHVWRLATDFSETAYPSNKKFYYVPISGYALSKDCVMPCVKKFAKALYDSRTKYSGVTVYGIRKGEIDRIKSLPNWINIDELFSKNVEKIVKDAVDDLVIKKYVGGFPLGHSQAKQIIAKIKDQKCDFVTLFSKYNSNGVHGGSLHQVVKSLEWLMQTYAKDSTFNVSVYMNSEEEKFMALKNKYPLMFNIDANKKFDNITDAIAEYVNFINSKKGK